MFSDGPFSGMPIGSRRDQAILKMETVFVENRGSRVNWINDLHLTIASFMC